MTAFAVVPSTGLETGTRLAGAEVIAVRQLAVLVEANTLGADEPIARYRRIVEDAFVDRSVVPLPYGTTFRSRASVARWLELHHSPLQEALDFVSDRATMRVRVGVTGSPATGAAAASVENRLWSTLRDLKGDAVAAIPVVPRADGSSADRSAACAYLIEREAIAAFEQRVASLTSRETHLRVELLGPLPPYDFITMDFGG